METAKFTPNEEDIRLRAEIKPFGRAATYEIVPPEPIEFNLFTSESTMPAERPEEVVQADHTSVYVPPVLNKASFSSVTTEVSVRISNIPLNITNRELYDLFMNRCGRCFNRCNLIFDKETRISKGVAYIGCESQEKAVEFAKQAMNIVVDNFKFSAEILNNR